MLSFIVQARLGSTRLPGKILLPFSNGKCILDILLDRLQTADSTVQVVIATTLDKANDPILEWCQKKDVLCFRGSENDVLDRFIKASEATKTDRIIRVCSDNPFLSVSALRQIVQKARITKADYVGFDVFGRPSILTHYGFWTEYVSLNALRKAQVMTQDKLFHEHVTNFVYTHPDHFTLEWIPSGLEKDDKIRLTIDTMADFQSAQSVYETLGFQADIPQIMSYVLGRKDLMDSMSEEIKQNSK